WLSTADVERRLEASPWIAAARVSRTLPSTITISITERTAAAVLRSGPRAFLVAADGMVLAAGTSGRLPAIDLAGARPEPRVGTKDAAAQPGLRILGALPGSLRSRVRTARMDGSGDL